MRQIKFIGILFLIALKSYGWNAMGHKLVAQIAYDNLTPEARAMCNQYYKSHSKSKKGRRERTSPDKVFITSAVWLDLIKRKDVHWFDTMHYIDIPYSQDTTQLPELSEINASWAIKQSVAVLSSKKASIDDKNMSLRILTHVMGDIHQPLHTITKVSNSLPKGDLGGNLFKLAHNPIGDNLHQYWDNGGGILIGPSKQFQVRNKAHQLESKWSCKLANAQGNPKQWINSSHQLALSQVYTIAPNQIPSKKYQLNAQTVTQRQILFAGCRLAKMINDIAKTQMT